MAKRKMKKIRNQTTSLYGVRVIWQQASGRLVAGWAWDATRPVQAVEIQGPPRNRLPFPYEWEHDA